MSEALPDDKVTLFQHHMSTQPAPILTPLALDSIGKLPVNTSSGVMPRYSAAFSGGMLSYAFPNNANVRSCQIPIAAI